MTNTVKQGLSASFSLRMQVEEQDDALQDIMGIANLSESASADSALEVLTQIHEIVVMYLNF